jgi:hypothetical protein
VIAALDAPRRSPRIFGWTVCIEYAVGNELPNHGVADVSRDDCDDHEDLEKRDAAPARARTRPRASCVPCKTAREKF